MRCPILSAPSTQTVEVSACSLKAESAFKAMARFGPGYPLLAENCKAVSETLLLLNQKWNILPFQLAALRSKEDWKIMM